MEGPVVQRLRVPHAPACPRAVGRQSRWTGAHGLCPGRAGRAAGVRPQPSGRWRILLPRNSPARTRPSRSLPGRPQGRRKRCGRKRAGLPRGGQSHPTRESDASESGQGSWESPGRGRRLTAAARLLSASPSSCSRLQPWTLCPLSLCVPSSACLPSRALLADSPALRPQREASWVPE